LPIRKPLFKIIPETFGIASAAFGSLAMTREKIASQ
jgi:hypothetical protein